MAEEGARALGAGLPLVVRDPANLGARSRVLYGAWLAGAALGAVSMGLHHKLCHVLGGSFGLPHAETHAIVLPHVVAYNAAAAPDALGRVASALGGSDAAVAIFELGQALGIKTALREIGMRAEDLDRAAELATSQAYPNPEPPTPEGVRMLLEAAYEGRRPGAHSS